MIFLMEVSAMMNWMEKKGNDSIDGGPGFDECEGGKGIDTIVNCEEIEDEEEEDDNENDDND